jgi:hypothetical protein
VLDHSDGDEKSRERDDAEGDRADPVAGAVPRPEGSVGDLEHEERGDKDWSADSASPDPERSHEEEGGEGASPVAAAVILADKADVHRSRVRKTAKVEFDIHDRVNYAAEQSFLRVDSGARTITLELTIDTEISQVMEYFEIFLGRMVMCRRAADRLDCQFKLTINGATLL